MRKAAELVDATHAYIVLLPGRHLSGAVLDRKKVTIAGNGATIAFTGSFSSLVQILNGSQVHMRDVAVEDTGPKIDDLGAIIASDMSEVTVNNMQGNTSLYDSIASTAGSLTIKNSIFHHHSISVTGHLIADNCQFLNAGPIVIGAIDITNSVIVATAPQFAIYIGSPDSSMGNSTIVHNTLIGGVVSCQPTGTSVQFNSNILINSSIPQVSSTCYYRYNLTFPQANITGLGNVTGDPLFADRENNDFHLVSGSPAIDAADPADLLTSHDLDGTARPQGTRSDIGAFEYVR